MTQKTLSDRALAQLVLLAGVWGASFLSIRIALDEIGPLTLVAHRTIWAALVLWAYVIARGLAVPRGVRVWGALVVMGLLNNLVPFSLMAWGQQHIATGLVAILNASTAIWGVLIASLAFADERLTPRRALGVSLGFAGVAAAVGWRSVLDLDLRSAAQIAVVLGALSYALAGAFGRARLSGLAPEVAAAGMLGTSAAMALALAWAVEGRPSLALAPMTWGAIAYVALPATAGAYVVYWRVLALAGSGNLLLVTLLVAPLAIALGALVRHEALGPGAWLGFGLLALGLVVLDGRVGRRLRRARAPLRAAGD